MNNVGAEMDGSPAEATNYNVGGQARPDANNSEDMIEDNSRRGESEKIQNIVTQIVRLEMIYYNYKYRHH